MLLSLVFFPSSSTGRGYQQLHRFGAREGNERQKSPKETGDAPHGRACARIHHDHSGWCRAKEEVKAADGMPHGPGSRTCKQIPQAPPQAPPAAPRRMISKQKAAAISPRPAPRLRSSRRHGGGHDGKTMAVFVDEEDPTSSARREMPAD